MVNAGPRQLSGRFGIPSSNVMNRAECTIPCRLRRISSRSLVYRVAAFSAALCRQRAVAGRGDAGQEPALAKAGVPDTIAFQTKPEIALEQIKSAYAAGLPQGVVLMDAGYGNDTDLRTQVTALGLSYVAGIGANTAVWPPGTAPLPPLPGSGRGRPPKLLRRDGEHHPVSVKMLAHELAPEAWHNIAWREGSADWLASRFARWRVRPAHRDTWRAEPHAEEWLLIEWPQGEPEPAKYWLSTLPNDI